MQSKFFIELQVLYENKLLFSISQSKGYIPGVVDPQKGANIIRCRLNNDSSLNLLFKSDYDLASDSVQLTKSINWSEYKEIIHMLKSFESVEGFGAKLKKLGWHVQLSQTFIEMIQHLLVEIEKVQSKAIKNTKLKFYEFLLEGRIKSRIFSYLCFGVSFISLMATSNDARTFEQVLSFSIVALLLITPPFLWDLSSRYIEYKSTKKEAVLTLMKFN
ncbi:hypothetical protein [Algicola sagamiensis]|uniref:hypothetical protein n=1 Tax=Algicola sagamiensis TaxID=163869 RepID=UPI0003716238|nr:hypothetical protein [Algicola sagamiensis]